MQPEFGKRTAAVRPAAETAAETTARPTRAQPTASDPTHIRRAMLAIVLTVVIVGGMFLLPKMGQCQGGRGAFGLDWCRLMKASVEGGVRGVAIGRGAAGSRY